MNDCLMGIWENICYYDPEKSSFKNWVGGIAKYKSLNYVRKYLKDLENENMENVTIPTEDNAIKEILSKEISLETEKMLKSLSEEDREIFKKLYFEDKNMDEVSFDTGFTKPVIYNRVSSTSEKRIKGKWEFEFTASGSELMANSHTLPMDYSFNIGDQKYILEEFRYNPVNQKIFGKVKGKSNDSYAIDLKGHDNLGNEVIFFLTSVSDEDLVFKYENIHGDLSDEITSITLIPYAAKYPEQSGKMSDDYKQVGEEFTIILSSLQKQ
jgi:RNA polymerase sigma factor (sigma-70 family)